MYDCIDGKTLMRKEYQEKEYQVSFKVSGADIENIIVLALETGVNHWASLDRSRQNLWAEKPPWMTASRFATQILIEGGGILLNDLNDPIAYHELTLQKLIRGISDYMCSPRALVTTVIQESDRLFRVLCPTIANEIIKTAIFGRR